MFFVTSYGISFPILKYDDISISLEVETNDLTSVLNLEGVEDQLIKNYSLVSSQLYLERIEMENDEYNRFKNINHEYLIDNFSKTFEYNFDNFIVDEEINLHVKSIKQIYFIIQNDDSDVFEYNDSLISGKILMNGKVVKHINPIINGIYKVQSKIQSNLNNIYIIPFSLYANRRRQPSGSLDLNSDSKLEIKLELSQKVGRVKIWFQYYDILRIMGNIGLLSDAEFTTNHPIINYDVDE